MKKSLALEMYTSFCVEQGLARIGVFEILSQHHRIKTVLYPGCFVHVVPSFFFPHVIYVDRGEGAQKFFANPADVLDIIRQHKHYKRAPYFQFIAQDYTEPLPVREASFDLLLSLYAPGITQACKSYLKTGGLLLTNNFQDDAEQAAADPELALIAVVQERGKVFTWRETELHPYLMPCPIQSRTHAANSPYTSKASYYLFQRVRLKPSQYKIRFK